MQGRPTVRSPRADTNRAALSGFKSREFGGAGYNQLVFYDKPIAHRRFEIVRGDGTTVRGHTDANGRTGLQKSDFLEQIRLRLLDEV